LQLLSDHVMPANNHILVWEMGHRRL
jgi:hypothetical protein